MWLEGRRREDLSYSDLEKLINDGAFNELGGLQHSSVIDSSLIDVYVPFLPLERQHVRKCVIKEAKDRNLTMREEDIMGIVDSLNYWPSDTKLYSTTGCKRISNKFDLYQEEQEEQEYLNEL